MALERPGYPTVDWLSPARALQPADVADVLAAAPVKRKRGRPAGQAMKAAAEQLRLHHFGFMRAVLELGELKGPWERYLAFEGGPDDERHRAARLRQLVKLARLAADARLARLQLEEPQEAKRLRPQIDQALARLAAVADGRKRDGRASKAGAVRATTARVADQAGGGRLGQSSAPAPAAAPVQAGAAVSDDNQDAGGAPLLDEWIDQRCQELSIDRDFQSEEDWLTEYLDAFPDEGKAASAAHAVQSHAGVLLPAVVHAAVAEAKLAAKSLAPADGGARVNANGDVSTALRTYGRSDEGADEGWELGPTSVAVDGLNALARLVEKPPALTDQLSAWLSEELSKRLAGTTVKGKALSLRSLGDLVAFVNGYGHRWWVHVPRLGAKRAARLVQWLSPLAEQLQHPVKDTARVPLHRVKAAHVAALDQQMQRDAGSARRFALVPLERLAVPRELDGHDGLFATKEENTLGVKTDLQAIDAWLRRYRHSPGTHATYMRTMERFYLWCLWVKRKAMSSLVEDDFDEYRQFVLAPPADWVQTRSLGRASPDWRPFGGPLDPVTAQREFSVISGCLNALIKAGYLRANAAVGVLPALRLPFMRRIDIHRSFSQAQWQWLIHCWQHQAQQCADAVAKAREDLADALHAQAVATAVSEASESAHADGSPGAAPLLPPSPAAIEKLRRKLAHAQLRAAYARRLELTLELASTTGLRLAELATTRLASVKREVFNGEPVWIASVLGKGAKLREVVIFEDVMERIELHHADMRAAGTDFDSSNAIVRTLRLPMSVQSAEPAGAHSSIVLSNDRAVGLPAEPSGRSHDDDAQDAGPPLIGALRRGPPRWIRDERGVLKLERDRGRSADRFGALDRSALYQSLKRFFRQCADKAETARDLEVGPVHDLAMQVDAASLAHASTHWLRHFFANNAIENGVEADVLREAMGHSSLSVTSIYVRAETRRLVAQMARLRRTTIERSPD